jgi:ubiquinone/menaquinone biosynthesis C-methylase UbiE
MNEGRVTDYDRIAERYDTRYGVYEYAGVRETLVNFLGDSAAVLEVGCGTGYWLDAMAAARLKWSPHVRQPEPPHSGGAKASTERLIGIDRSAPMLARAALSGADVKVPMRRFVFELDLSGKNKVTTFAQEETQR